MRSTRRIVRVEVSGVPILILLWCGAAIMTQGMIVETMPDQPQSDWDIVANNKEFKDLMAAKARFIVPATIFFIVYYFALPILVGYAPKLMATPVIGPV